MVARINKREEDQTEEVFPKNDNHVKTNTTSRHSHLSSLSSLTKEKKKKSKINRKSVVAVIKKKENSSSDNAVISKSTMGTMKLRKDEKANKDDNEIEIKSLLKKMEDFMALEQILEARKVVDELQPYVSAISNRHQGSTSSTRLINENHLNMISHVITESNSVLKLLHDLQSDEGWTNVSSPSSSKKNYSNNNNNNNNDKSSSSASHNERNEVTIHYRNEENSPIHATKTKAIFTNFTPTDFIHLVSLFTETDLMPHWFPLNLMKECKVLAEPSRYARVCHMKVSLGSNKTFIPVSPRDAVLNGQGYHLVDRNAILVFTKSTTESPYCTIPKVEHPYVRMDQCGAYLIQLDHKNEICYFSQILHQDMKIKYIPSFLLNWLSSGKVPYLLIRSIQRTLKNYNNSPWEKRLEEKTEFYNEIEKRLYSSEHKEKAEVLLSSSISTHVQKDITGLNDNNDANANNSNKKIDDNSNTSNTVKQLLLAVSVFVLLLVVHSIFVPVEDSLDTIRIRYAIGMIIVTLALNRFIVTFTENNDSKIVQEDNQDDDKEQSRPSSLLELKPLLTSSSLSTALPEEEEEEDASFETEQLIDKHPTSLLFTEEQRSATTTSLSGGNKSDDDKKKSNKRHRRQVGLKRRISSVFTKARRTSGNRKKEIL